MAKDRYHMRMNNTARKAFNYWGQAWRNEERTWLDPGPQLRKAFQIPLQGSVRIFGPGQSGMTAMALHIAQVAQSAGYPVVYLDFSHSVYAHRLCGFDLDRFYLPAVHSRRDVLRLLSEIDQKSIIVVDSVRNIREDWLTANPALSMRHELRSKVPNSTLIFCELSGKDNWIGPGWDVVLSLVDHQNHWVDGQRVGHEIGVRGPNGTAKAFISHTTGQVHLPYLSALEEQEHGKSINGLYGQPPVKGFWQYVYSSLKCE